MQTRRTINASRLIVHQPPINSHHFRDQRGKTACAELCDDQAKCGTTEEGWENETIVRGFVLFIFVCHSSINCAAYGNTSVCGYIVSVSVCLPHKTKNFCQPFDYANDGMMVLTSSVVKLWPEMFVFCLSTRTLASSW